MFKFERQRTEGAKEKHHPAIVDETGRCPVPETPLRFTSREENRATHLYISPDSSIEYFPRIFSVPLSPRFQRCRTARSFFFIPLCSFV